MLHMNCRIDKSTVPLGSDEEPSSLSHSDKFLIPKLHKILFRSVEFISMLSDVNVSMSPFVPLIASSIINHRNNIHHALAGRDKKKGRDE